ncbi:MAG: ankyrin repeat domain-containing protein [Gallionella sp.]|nr:ankyrin repeat domain-containing protein [Gallionella sp.]
MNDSELKCWLLQSGFNVDELNIEVASVNGTTPLMYAARLGNIEALAALLTRGADTCAMNDDGNGALWFACYSDNEACVAALIKAGAPLDTQNVNGATALIYCASTGKTPLVRLLLYAGADAALMTLDDFTALELAANIHCMRLLKETKGLVNV